MLVKGKKNLSRDSNGILLIQLGDIGDVVLSLPCIRALRENFTEAQITVAVRENAAGLIKDYQWASGVIAVTKEKRRLVEEIVYQKRFFRRLRRSRPEIAIDLRTGTRGAVLALASGARQRIGFYAFDGKLWRNRVFTHLVRPSHYPGQHMTGHYASILRAFELEVSDTIPHNNIPQEKLDGASDLLRNEGIPNGSPIFAVQPFSLWRYKEWGIDKYVRLIKWLTLEYGVTVIVTGSSEERKRAEELVGRCGDRTFNLAGKTPIGILAGVFKICALFIGGDSAGLHIAAAVGTPTAGIFGPSSSDDWAPRGGQHLVLAKEYSCVPCRKKGCDGREVSLCLEDLTFDEVRKKIRGTVKAVLKNS
ncbi:MAG: glycosyltransferase family 9 protein [Deltaproteobacteria bacterium]|nr:glycosyltransferase family 9 protein [Deltaproteobacteria bacterium]